MPGNQPSDLMSPVPSAFPQEINVNVPRQPASAPQPQPSPAPQAPTAQQPAQAEAGISQAFGSQDQMSPEIADAFGGEGLPSRFTPQPGEALGGTKDAGFWAHALANVGRSPQEMAQILENQLFGKGNVKVQGNKIYFRQPGDKDFSELDSEHLGTAAKFINMLGGLSGAATQAAFAAPVEALGATAGLPGALIAAPIAGAAGATGRAALAQRLMGTQGASDVPLGGEAALGAAGGVLGYGASAAMGKIVSAISSERMINRIQNIANIRAALNEFKQSFVPQHWLDSSGNLHPDAETYANVARAEADKLGQAVGAVKDMITQYGAEQKFQMPATRQQFKQLLEQQGAGIEFDPKTQLAKISPKFGEGTSGGPIAPFGMQGGEDVLGRVMNHYNTIVEAENHGGLTPDQVLRTTSLIEDLAKYDKSPLVQAKKVAPWKVGSGGAIQDRNAMVQTILPPDSPEYAQYQKAYKDFSSKIDIIRGFQDNFSKAVETGSANDFVKSVITPNNPNQIRNFRVMFGDEASDKLKGVWLDQLLNDHINNQGVFQGNKFLSTLKSYDPAITGGGKSDGLLLNAQEYRQLVNLGNKMEQIERKSGANLEEKQNVVRQFINSSYFAFGSKKYAGLLAAKAFRPDPFYDKAVSDVIDEAIQKAPRARVNDLLLFRDALQDGWSQRIMQKLPGAAAGQTMGAETQQLLSPTRYQEPKQ